MDDAPGYEPPVLTRLGSLAELTQVTKTTGAADGTMVLGLDVGSV